MAPARPNSKDAEEAAQRASLAERVGKQARWCERLGSPLYALLMDRAAADIEAGGSCWGALRDRPDDGSEYGPALRLFGAVHRLVLGGEAPALARHYPSAGGEPDYETVWPDFDATVAANRERVRELIARTTPQTNEVGRSAALLGGFLVVAGAGLPLRLLEVGASAGLNLRFDRYRYEAGDRAFGDPASPARLVDPWVGEPPPLETAVEVSQRRGCDLDPVDPTTPAGRLALASFLWPDQLDRLALLRAALEVAAQVPVQIDQAAAADWVEQRLSEPAPDAATVVFHSVVMPYLSAEEVGRFEAALERAGAAATAAAPLAWLHMERGGEQAQVRLTLWPNGEERLLAETSFHGRQVRWLA